MRAKIVPIRVYTSGHGYCPLNCMESPLREFQWLRDERNAARNTHLQPAQCSSSVTEWFSYTVPPIAERWIRTQFFIHTWMELYMKLTFHAIYWTNRYILFSRLESELNHTNTNMNLTDATYVKMSYLWTMDVCCGRKNTSFNVGPAVINDKIWRIMGSMLCGHIDSLIRIQLNFNEIDA